MSAVPAPRTTRPVPGASAVPPAPPTAPPRPAPARRPYRGDRGWVTAETAVLLPFLMVVLALSVWVVSLGITQVRLVDAAREGARAVARGDDEDLVRAVVAREGPTGAVVRITARGGTTTVEVRAHRAPDLPLLRAWGGVDLGARAVAPDEAGNPA